MKSGEWVHRGAVAFADTSPFVSGGGRRWRMRLPDAAEFVARSFQAKRVSPNYLEVMRIPTRTRASALAF